MCTFKKLKNGYVADIERETGAYRLCRIPV